MKQLSKWLTLATAIGVVSGSVGRAQTAPPGWIYDFQASHPAELDGYELLSTTFVASLLNTTVSFAFREVPAYWGFDDVSVTDGAGPNLLADPGFESSTDGSNFPDQWSRWIQPIDVSAIGAIASPTAPYGCQNYGPHSGNEFWCDGSVEGYDALYQTVATTPGDTYTISWYMSDNSHDAPTDPGINMYVYAQDGIPVGTIPITGTPEPATWSLMGTGLLGMVGFARRRRNQNV